MMIRKCMSMLLALTLLLSLLPAGTVAAKEPERIRTRVDINPEYAGMISPNDLPELSTQGKVEFDNASGYLSVSEAGKQVRKTMIQRGKTVDVSFYTTESDEETAVFLALYAGMEHTGKPTEGDYLLKQYAGSRASYYVDYGYYNGQWVYQYDVTYTIDYLTTASQEAEMDLAVEALLEQLNLGGQDDYHKFMAVYDYICENITYDYENLEDDNYLLKHSAYAALIHKTAVCQGYALLLYRLMLELGIDCRYISGYSYGGRHGWNIVQMDGLYYNADSTWDAGSTAYDWCLRNDANFPDHSRDTAYATNAFYAEYPMGISDYVYTGAGVGTVAYGICGDNLTWKLTGDGVLTISGTGDMYDYGDRGITYEAPWADYRGQILELVIADTVTSIGHEAFRGCEALTELDFPTGVTTLGDRAFAYCTSLKTVTIGSDCQGFSLYDEAFLGCDNLTKFYLGQINIITEATNRAWWEGLYLLKCVEWLYVETSAGTPVDHIAYGFACDNGYTTVTVDGISYRRYQRGIHDYDSTTVEPTCTNDGYVEYWCFDCGYSFQEVLEAGHDWDELYTCRVCGWEPDYLVDMDLHVSDLELRDGIYYTVDGHCAVLALDVPLEYLNGYTLKDYVDAYGSEYFLMNDWYPLEALMNEDGFVTLTPDTLDMFIKLITGNPNWGEDASYITYYLGIRIIRDHNLSQVVVDSGICGDDLTWKLTADGTLTISGTGDMYHYGEDGVSYTAPWYFYADQILTLDIADTVTSIGHEAFQGFTALGELTIPSGVEVIGYRAFADCTYLYQVTIGADCVWETSYAQVFAGCYNLQDVYLLYEKLITNGTNQKWWDNTCLLESALRVWVLASVDAPVRHIDPGFCCTEEPGLYEIDGVLYWMYVRGEHRYNTSWVDATCVEEGYLGHTCVYCDYVYKTDYVDALGHTAVEDRGWAPTCTEDGRTDGSHCVTCGEVIEVQEVIPALGHTYQNGICIRCGDVNSTGDGWGNWSDYVDPDTIVIYPVEGGNLYFGQEIYWGDYERATQIALVSADSTVTKAVIPDTVNGLSVVGILGLGDCDSLVDVYIPASVQWIADFTFISAMKLEKIEVAWNNPKYFSEDGVLYCLEYGDVSLLVYPARKPDKNYKIYDGTTHIIYYAFSGAANLQSVVIPDSVVFIEYYAFEYCSSLTDIYYTGSKAQWESIDIWCSDPAFVNATIHYNSTGADEETVQPGDVNGDGQVNTTDAKLIMQYDLGTIGQGALLLAAADVNGDGQVNTTDAKLIMQLDLGLITAFPKAN